MDNHSFNDAKLRATHEVLMHEVEHSCGDLRLVDPTRIAELVNNTFSYLLEPPENKRRE
ncbi:hypothetical protein LTE61_004375 [Salmonella enterica subsp. enterica serovar Westminster]|nr:hypothetical protein [Salmonella enterica subsp. enterica serovar Westminster]